MTRLLKYSITHLNGVITEPQDLSNGNFASPKAIQFMAEMVKLGYVPTEKLLLYVDLYFTKETMKTVLLRLREIVGSDVKHRPMYPNFPEQVKEMASLELWYNAITHYFTLGEWLPAYTENIREIDFETVKLIELDVLTSDHILQHFDNLLSANRPITPQAKEAIQSYVMEYGVELFEVGKIPNKENLVWVIQQVYSGILDNVPIDVFSTPTDILRLAVMQASDDSDLTLPKNVKFGRYSRPERRVWLQFLEWIFNDSNRENVTSNKGLWKRFLTALHPGDYKNQYPYVAALADDLFKDNVESFNAKVDELLKEEYGLTSRDRLFELLSTRPGEFARRLDFLMGEYESRPCRAFYKVIDKVSTRVLVQLLAHFHSRRADKPRAYFDKHGKSILNLIPASKRELRQGDLAYILGILTGELSERFPKPFRAGIGAGIDSVYMDPSLMDIPLEMSPRDVSTGKRQISRGSRLHLKPSASTIRLGVYWVGKDIDLSAVFLDANYNQTSQVSYTQLKNGVAYHSGDITYAPNGASEFIDIDIEKALADGHRYVMTNVYVYSGPTFKHHDKAYMFWMEREFPNSNEIFEAATIENKIDLTMDGRQTVPCLFDLKTREVIWVDVAMQQSRRFTLHSTEANVGTNQSILKAVIEGLPQISIYNLLLLTIPDDVVMLESPEEAELVFDADFAFDQEAHGTLWLS